MEKNTIIIYPDLVVAYDEDGNQINEASTYTIGCTWQEVKNHIRFAMEFYAPLDEMVNFDGERIQSRDVKIHISLGLRINSYC